MEIDGGFIHFFCFFIICLGFMDKKNPKIIARPLTKAEFLFYEPEGIYNHEFPPVEIVDGNHRISILLDQ
jgi:hypothetical protein